MSRLPAILLVTTRRAGVLAGLALILLVAVTYRGSLANGFHFDDPPNIVQNPTVRMERPGLEGLLRAALDSPNKRRPLPNVSFAIDWWRGGGRAETFQWTNLALHAANSLLVFGLLMTVLTAGRGRSDLYATAAALSGAALWAVHPIQVQAVTYIVQRMAQMACLFTVLAVLLYLGGRFSPRRRAAAVFLTLCGIAVLAGALSKENAWAAPLLLVLAELGVVRNDRPLLRSRPERAALILLAAAAVAAFAATAAGVGPLAQFFEAGYSRRDFTMAERLLTQPRVVLFHLSQMLWPLPSRFSVEHDFQLSRSLFDPPATWLALGAVLAWCTAGCWLLGRRGKRTLGFLMLWVPATLVIESSLAPLEMVFEHRMYLPSIGIMGLLALALDRLFRRIPRPALTAGPPLAVLLTLLAGATGEYLPVWRSPVTLGENSVRHAPRSARAWSTLGQAYLQEGREVEAEQALRRSLALDPDQRFSLEWYGIILFDRGRLAEAGEYFQRALRKGRPTSSLYNHLGEVELARGLHGRAESLFRLAAELKPWIPAYRWNRALALEGLGRCGEALAEWREYLRLERDDEASKAQARGHIRTRHQTVGGACYPVPAPGGGATPGVRR